MYQQKAMRQYVVIYHYLCLYRHTIGHSTPLPDQNSSAVIDESVFVNGTVLTMSFSRLIMASPLDNEDVSLVDPPRYWIWAVGEYDNGMFLQHNSTGRGVSPGPIMFPPLSSCVPGQHALQYDYRSTGIIMMKNVKFKMKKFRWKHMGLDIKVL